MYYVIKLEDMHSGFLQYPGVKACRSPLPHPQLSGEK